MDKKEFMLEPDDLNQLLEITANEMNVIQIEGDRAVYKTQADRAMMIWKKFGSKYGFYPETVEANIPNRDVRYFMAVPVEKVKPDMDQISVAMTLGTLTPEQKIISDRVEPLIRRWMLSATDNVNYLASMIAIDITNRNGK
jgi:hypothetical protein